MAKAISMKLTDHEGYRKESEGLEETRAELADLDRRISAEEETLRKIPARASLTERALRELDGTPEDTVALPTPEGIKKLRDRRALLHEMERIRRGRLDVFRQAVSKEICNSLRTEYEKIHRAIAETGIAFTEAVEKAYGLRSNLQGHGISYEGNLPQFALDWARGSEETSKMNRLITEISEVVGIKVSRPILEAAVKARGDAVMKEQKAKLRWEEKEAKERARRVEEAQERARDPRNRGLKEPTAA